MVKVEYAGKLIAGTMSDNHLSSGSVDQEQSPNACVATSDNEDTS